MSDLTPESPQTADSGSGVTAAVPDPADAGKEVTTATSAPADPGNEATSGEVGSPAGASIWWWISSWSTIVLLVAAAGVTAGLSWWACGLAGGQRQDLYSVALGTITLAVALALPALTGGNFGLWTLIIGKDNRVSTSKTQLLLWTAIVGFLVVYFISRTWFGHVKGLFDGFVPGGNNAGTGSAWPDYLVLLGGPFAGLVVAKASVTAKTDSKDLQKIPATDDQVSPAQIVTDDDGNPDLVDTQYFLFNLAAMIYVLIGFVQEDALPQIPGLLLALTGVSAAGYAANKTIGSNKPVISALTPLLVRPGDELTISGSNFIPPGTSVAPTVTVGGSKAEPPAGATSSMLKVMVPPGVAAGTQDVVVVTAAGVASDQQVLTVAADRVEILSISPSGALPGATLTISGVGFTSPLDPSTNCTVTVGGDPATNASPERASAGLERLTMKLSDKLEPKSVVDIAVATDRGLTSKPWPYTLGGQ